MKRIVLFTSALLLSLAMLAGCSSNKSASTAAGDRLSGAVTSPEQLSFPLGQKVNAPAFVGTMYFSAMIANDTTYNFPQTNLTTFEPGARSSWHTHGGMIVLVVDGIGYYQEEGKKAQVLRKGDIVQIPEGVKHWHGATADSWFSQIVIYDSHWQGNHGDSEIVHLSDSEYASLESEEYTGRDKVRFGDLMFNRAEKSVQFPTFSGEAYVSNLVGAENVAGAPGLHYVVFEQGVYNNWHTHEGGQILIATDGIGYHQIAGGEVQVLHPGDVTLCPPGVKHWHGGSLAGQFAHIAANTNPEKTGLEWFDRISEEEYSGFAHALPKE